MAIIKEKVLASVEVCVSASAMQVTWLNRIIENGEIISALPHRKAYCQEQKDEFLAEVESPENGGSPGLAAPYLVALGW